MVKEEKVSVALFTYRKIEFLKEILDLIGKYNPPYLYIFQNKHYNKAEKKIVSEVSDFLKNYNYKHSVVFVKQKKHLKINDHFYFSLNFAFNRTDRLIILEDDTIPSLSFFYFCELMLNKFNNNSEIGAINGNNLNSCNIESSYFLSSLALPFWGWATWKSKWELYRDDKSYWNFKEKEILLELSQENKIKIKEVFEQLSPESRFITWDILWNWTLMANNLKTIVPGQNLVSNKGFYFKGSSTNYVKSSFSNLKTYEMGNDLGLLSSQENVINYENAIISLSTEIQINQSPRVYDDFKDVFLQKNKFEIVSF